MSQEWVQYLGLYLGKKEIIDGLAKDSQEKEKAFQEAQKKLVDEKAELKICEKELIKLVQANQICNFICSRDGIAYKIVIDRKTTFIVGDQELAEDKRSLLRLAKQAQIGFLRSDDINALQAFNFIQNDCPVICVVFGTTRSIITYRFFLKIQATGVWKWAMDLYES
ncbi:MAG: hypothetical protein WCT18_04520 [Patescibacteria group bacterium]